MLSEKPEERPKPSTIYSILSPFEAEILSLRPFNPDYETVKRALAESGAETPSTTATSSTSLASNRFQKKDENAIA
jgi:hypothetical protein